jgi:hypothetical protein
VNGGLYRGILTYGAEPFLRSRYLLPTILWNPKFQYRVHKSTPLVPILSHVHSVQSIPSYLSKIHFNIVHPPTFWSSQWLFWLPHQYPICIPLLPIRATCPFIVVAMEREVTAWFRQQPKEFYAAGFQGLVKRWDRCLSVQLDYVEK